MSRLTVVCLIYFLGAHCSSPLANLTSCQLLGRISINGSQLAEVDCSGLSLNSLANLPGLLLVNDSLQSTLLNFSNNHLQSLSGIVGYTHFLQVTKLDITNNNFTSLDTMLLANSTIRKSLAEVRCSGNPFNCSCLQEIVSSFTLNSTRKMTHLKYSDSTCACPTNLFGDGCRKQCNCSGFAPVLTGRQCHIIEGTCFRKPIFAFFDGNDLALLVTWNLFHGCNSDVDLTLSYGLSEVSQHSPITLQIPRNQTAYSLQTPLFGFLFQFNLTVFINGTSSVYSTEYRKQSVCPLTKFGNQCQYDCGCFPLSNVGTCNVRTGQCYCPSLLANATAVSVIAAPQLIFLDVQPNKITFSLRINTGSDFPPNNYTFTEKLVLFQKVDATADLFRLSRYHLAANCTLPFQPCVSSYLLSDSQYAFIVKTSYSANAGYGKSAECLSGVSYMKTKRHICPSNCMCLETMREQVDTDCSARGYFTVPQNISRLSTRISLDRNFISVIPEDAFKHIKWPLFINLSRNVITDIKTEGFPSTAVLDFSWNRLADGNTLCRAFANSTRLQYLYLDHNLFSRLNCSFKDYGRPPVHLMQLRISHNFVQEVAGTSFEGLQQLNILELESNLLHFFPTQAIIETPSLGSLSLQNNKIATIQDTDIPQLPRLWKLILRGNGLNSVRSHAFSRVPRLSLLDLSLNNLQNILPTLFINNTHLTNVHLEDNLLMTLPQGLLSTTYFLYHLNVTNNSLAAVSPEAFIGPNRLTNFECEHNPFNCSCAKEWAQNVFWTQFQVPPNSTCECFQCDTSCPCNVSSRLSVCLSIGSSCTCRSEVQQRCNGLPNAVLPMTSDQPTPTRMTSTADVSASAATTNPVQPTKTPLPTQTDAASSQQMTIAYRPTVNFRNSESGLEPYIYGAIGGGSLLLIIMIIVIPVACFRKRKAGSKSRNLESMSFENMKSNAFYQASLAKKADVSQDYSSASEQYKRPPSQTSENVLYEAARPQRKWDKRLSENVLYETAEESQM